MQRFGYVGRLRPEAIREYEEYHREVWPEVLATLRKSGIRNYTIYRYQEWLFSYLELPDGTSIEEAEKTIMSDPVSKKWEDVMRGLFSPLPDSKEGTWVPMKELWGFQ